MKIGFIGLGIMGESMAENIVKKHDDDPEVDICSVVAYALAEKVYGSNSAFKREIRNSKIEWVGSVEVTKAECVL